MPVETMPSPKVEVRLTPEALSLVEQAAETQGRTPGDFIAEAALEAAGRAVEGPDVLRLSVEDQRRLLELFLDMPVVGT